MQYQQQFVQNQYISPIADKYYNYQNQMPIQEVDQELERGSLANSANKNSSIKFNNQNDYNDKNDYNDYVNCPQHINNKVTQICIYNQCNEPLCSQCILQHQEYHQERNSQAQIANISQVRAESLQKVEKIVNSYNNNQIKKILPIDQSLKTLHETKKQIHDLIENYFNELEIGLVQTQDHQQSQNEYEHYCNLKQELEGQYYIQALLEILEEKEQVDQSYQLALDKQNKQFQGREIFKNEAKLNTIKQELSNFVYLRNIQGKIDININSTEQQQKQNQIDGDKNQTTQICQNDQTQTEVDNFLQEQNQIQKDFSKNQQKHNQKQINSTVPIVNLRQSQFENNNNNSKQQQIKVNTQNDKISPNSDQNTDHQKMLKNYKNKLSKLNEIDQRIQKLSQSMDFEALKLHVNVNNSVIQENSILNETFKTNFNKSYNHNISIDKEQKYSQKKIGIIDITGPEIYSYDFKLYYFQKNSKKLFEANYNGNVVQFDFTEIICEPNFKIPNNHQCIFTPNDGIFLIGGINNLQYPFLPTEKVYNLQSFNYKEIHEHSNLNNRRAGFGACYLNNNIYVCGGYDKGDEGSTLSDFEHLDVRTNKWVQLKQSYYKSSFCTLVPFENKYIFKIGGKSNRYSMTNKIEYYDIEENEWNIVVFNENSQNIQIPSDCGAIQINRKQILIFGGKVYEAKTQNAFILDIDLQESGYIDANNFYIKQILDMPFPTCVYNQPILKDGEVITFVEDQQITNSLQQQQNNQKNLERKKILKFNGTQWKEI